MEHKDRWYLVIDQKSYYAKTILLASHNQVDIDELCDTVCEMEAGVMTLIR